MRRLWIAYRDSTRDGAGVRWRAVVSLPPLLAGWRKWLGKGEAKGGAKMRTLDLFVEGIPVPQGSKTPILAGWKPGQMQRPKTALVESSDMRKRHRLKRWRQTVRFEANATLGSQGAFRDAVRLSCEFVFPRPASHFTKSGRLKQGAPRDATSMRLGDLSKLIRAVEDALTDAGVWPDDSAVTEYGYCRKRYAEAGEKPGAMLRVQSVEA